MQERQAGDQAMKQKRVLVVEDDPAVARMLRFSLRRAGFDVIAVTTGGEAVQQLAGDTIDAVVLDVGLPDGRAGDVLTQLRDPKAPAREWVVVTAQDRDDVTRRFGSLEGHFMSKPFDPWALAERLQRPARNCGYLT